MTDMTHEQIEMIEKAKAERTTVLSMKIKRAAVLRVRRFFFGLWCAPTLKDQALTFCSFGTLVKMEWLTSDERYWN